jgi:hypothetical protein
MTGMCHYAQLIDWDGGHDKFFAQADLKTQSSWVSGITDMSHLAWPRRDICLWHCLRPTSFNIFPNFLDDHIEGLFMTMQIILIKKDYVRGNNQNSNGFNRQIPIRCL